MRLPTGRTRPDPLPCRSNPDQRSTGRSGRCTGRVRLGEGWRCRQTRPREYAIAPGPAMSPAQKGIRGRHPPGFAAVIVRFYSGGGNMAEKYIIKDSPS